MPIFEITDLNAPELDAYTRLTEAQLRNRLEPEKGLFIAQSLKVIELAVRCGYRPTSFLMEEKHLENPRIKAFLEGLGDVPIYTATDTLLSSLTGYPLTRGALCAMRRPPLPTAEELCGEAGRIAVLEGIVDATNIGAIFRSAAALNMDAVLVTPTCCDPLNRRAVRVSMGTVFQVPWTYVDNVEKLKGLGFSTAALALKDDSVSIDDPCLQKEKRLAIVLGAEGDGLSPEALSSCDYIVRIPMARQVDSLNVAAASAVAFWELRPR